jgi:hypothetical protein
MDVERIRLGSLLSTESMKRHWNGFEWITQSDSQSNTNLLKDRRYARYARNYLPLSAVNGQSELPQANRSSIESAKSSMRLLATASGAVRMDSKVIK